MTDKITKKEYFNLDNGIVQDITQKFIQNDIYRNQSSLITHLQENFVEGFNFDDVENFYMSDEEIIKEYAEYCRPMTDEQVIEHVRNNGEDMNEIFEWYLVSDWFLERLREINEPIIDNDYGEYWGRCCTGQAICLDHNIQELAYKYSYDKRLYKNEEVA